MKIPFLFLSILFLSTAFLKPEFSTPSINSTSTFLPLSNDTLYYLFSGHTYYWGGGHDRVDFRLEGLDHAIYNRIWLGGDICSESLLEPHIILYLDSLFNLQSPGNHFALGNHDHRNGNLEWLEDLTGRPTYYSHSQDGITTLVLNTNLNPSNCEDLDRQYRLIKNVCDTIQSSSHLILLHHHHIWKDVPGIPPGNQVANGGLNYWNANCQEVGNYFSNSIYPLLIEVENRGVEVICVMGDAGWRKGSSDQSTEGIDFITSGINNTFYLPDTTAFQNAEKDKLLIFKHIPQEGKLEWTFQELDSLYAAHN